MPRSPRTGVTAFELLILLIVLGAIALYARRRFAETPVERTEATLKAALSEVVGDCRAVCGGAALVDSRAINCAPRLAAHPGKVLVRLQKDIEQALGFNHVKLQRSLRNPRPRTSPAAR